MKDKFPEIYKRKINNLKTKIQNDFYYHNKKEKEEEKYEDIEKLDVKTLREKINNIFKRSDYVYQADITIMYKTGDIITDKIIGFKDDYILLKEKGKVNINEIKNIK